MKAPFYEGDLESKTWEEEEATAVSNKAERKKYLKKTGKSLWMKNKTKKVEGLSVDVSTKSSEGPSSFYSSVQIKATVRINFVPIN